MRIAAFLLITAFFATTVNAQGITFFVGSGAQYTTGTDPSTVCSQYAKKMSTHSTGTFVYAQNWNNPWPTSGNKMAGICHRYGSTGGYLGPGEVSYNLQPCPEGTFRNPETGICAPPPCQAGTEHTLDLGVGYAKTQKYTNDWINPVFHATSCVAGCQVSVGSIVSGSCYTTATIGPPYAGYCTFNATNTGSSCTGADESTTDALPPIPCPSGTQPGSVNGVSGCYTVTTAETTKNTVTNPDGSTTTTETTTSATGSTTITTTCTGAGSCSSTTTHVGGGGSSSTPATSGQNYDGQQNGQEDGQEDGKPCGAPGQPKCDVKVDEDGTPTEAPPTIAQAYGEALAAVDSQMEYLAGSGWIKEELPFFWNPTLPNSTCSAFQIYGHTIDICSTADLVRNIWSYCFLFMTALYIWSRATNVNKGS